LLSEVWRELQTILQPIFARPNQQERRLELHGGGVVEMWSLDSPDAGCGRAYALEDYTRREVVVGECGGQMASFEWVFSPRGAGGLPVPMFDRTTGAVEGPALRLLLFRRSSRFSWTGLRSFTSIARVRRNCKHNLR